MGRARDWNPLAEQALLKNERQKEIRLSHLKANAIGSQGGFKPLAETVTVSQKIFVLATWNTTAPRSSFIHTRV